jgi:hypothetical protein
MKPERPEQLLEMQITPSMTRDLARRRMKEIET